MNTDCEKALDKLLYNLDSCATYKWLSWKTGLHPNVCKMELNSYYDLRKKDFPSLSILFTVLSAKDEGGTRRVALSPDVVPEKFSKNGNQVSHFYCLLRHDSETTTREAILLEAARRDRQLDLPTVCVPIRCEAASRKRAIAYIVPTKSVTETESSKPQIKSSGVPTTTKKSTPAKKNSPTKKASPAKKASPKKSLFASLGKASEKKKPESFSPTKKSPRTQKSAASTAQLDNSSKSFQNTEKSETPSMRTVFSSEQLDGSPVKSSRRSPDKFESESPIVRKKRSRKVVRFTDSDEEQELKEEPLAKVTRGSPRKMIVHDETPEIKTESVIVAKGRRRILKEVTKTYRDDEGYLVTKIVKEMVSESDDDDEVVSPPQKPAKSPLSATNDSNNTVATSKKGKAKNSDGRKQQTLFSFFNKK